ncbi:hypothetical protein BDZ89DRAFT_1070453 [Hymenopellis radicata]|nr:hypothetical protein BDZ89DRAFT_1070453 [Hymenopellis radicata]
MGDCRYLTGGNTDCLNSSNVARSGSGRGTTTSAATSAGSANSAATTTAVTIGTTATTTPAASATARQPPPAIGATTGAASAGSSATLGIGPTSFSHITVRSGKPNGTKVTCTWYACL